MLSFLKRTGGREVSVKNVSAALLSRTGCKCRELVFGDLCLFDLQVAAAVAESEVGGHD